MDEQAIASSEQSAKRRDEHGRFPKGVSGNPGGRPKGCSIKAPLLRKLAERPSKLGEGRRASVYAERLLKLLDRDTLTKGQVALVKSIFDLIEISEPSVKESAITVDNYYVVEEAGSEETPE